MPRYPCSGRRSTAPAAILFSGGRERKRKSISQTFIRKISSSLSAEKEFIKKSVRNWEKKHCFVIIWPFKCVRRCAT